MRVPRFGGVVKAILRDYWKNHVYLLGMICYIWFLGKTIKNLRLNLKQTKKKVFRDAKKIISKFFGTHYFVRISTILNTRKY